MTCRGPFHLTPFWDCGALEIARALGGLGSSFLAIQQWNKAGPGWTWGQGMEQGRHKPVLSKLWARGGGERV